MKLESFPTKKKQKTKNKEKCIFVNTKGKKEREIVIEKL